MKEVQLKLIDNKGAFIIEDKDTQIAEMEISISGSNLTVHHTGVEPEYEGQGLAKQLLEAMVDHARQQNMKVTPLCSYVALQFKRHPDLYQDITK